MSEPMLPEEHQELIAGYVLYDLSPEEFAALEQLMNTDPSIAQDIDQMQRALEQAYAPPEVEPPEHLRASVVAAYRALSESKSTIKVAKPISFPQPKSVRRRHWARGLGAAAAMAIVGLSISNYVMWRSLRATQAQLQAAYSLIVSLEPTETGSTASAQVKIDPDNLKAALQVDNLPPLSEGQVYVLWTVLQPDAPFTTDDKDAILTQVFTANDQSSETASILLPRVYREEQWIKAIAITIEAAEAPQQHLSSPILIHKL